METSLFIAKIFGICYLVLGAGLLLNREAFQRIIEEVCKNAALIYFSGLAALAVGLAIILNHNEWTAHWTVIITIIGWAAFVKGLWLVLFPGSVIRWIQIYQEKKTLLTVNAVAALVLGAILTWCGFFAG